MKKALFVSVLVLSFAPTFGARAFDDYDGYGYAADPVYGYTAVVAAPVATYGYAAAVAAPVATYGYAAAPVGAYLRLRYRLEQSFGFAWA